MPNRIGLRPRIAAVAIDLAGIVLLAMLFGPWVGIRLGLGHYDGQGLGAGGMMAGATAGTQVIALLWLAPEALWGTGPGKALLGLAIGNEQGQPLPRRRAALRWALKTSPALVGLLAVIVSLAAPRVGGWLTLLSDLCAVVLLAGCFVALGSDQQALHDVLAGSAIYRRAELAPPPE
jgi:RDD family